MGALRPEDFYVQFSGTPTVDLRIQRRVLRWKQYCKQRLCLAYSREVTSIITYTCICLAIDKTINLPTKEDACQTRALESVSDAHIRRVYLHGTL